MANSNPNTAIAQPGPKSFAVTARESLESIVIAFALAFIFRAFIVEAFVIPTGSMAPTLYGQQVTHTCSTCGFEYARGIDDQMVAASPSGFEMTLKCPNCGSIRDKIPRAELVRPSSGDRILVHKWPFSMGGSLSPRRWDVTVFKDPHNGTINFIKRLVGKPGEILEIIHGDVFTASLDEVRQKDPGLITDMDQLRRDLYQYSQGQLRLDRDEVAARYQAINQRLIPYLRIQRKAVDAPDAQESLWFNVYNRNYLTSLERTKGQPESRVGWSPLILSRDSLQPEQLELKRIPQDLRRALEQAKVQLPENPTVIPEKSGEWRVNTDGGDLLIVKEENCLAVYEAAAKAAWDTSGPDIRFNSDSDRLLNIRFSGKPIDDFYGYNFSYSPQGVSQGRVPVGDLRLGFVWFPQAGNGALVLEMNRHKDNFVARIQMDGMVEIHHWAPGASKGTLIGQTNLEPFRHGKAVPIEFVNVDFRVSLAIDGREVLASTDQQYAPDVPELLSRNGEEPDQTDRSQVRIGGQAMRFRIDHLELDRDVYYRSGRLIEAHSPPPQPGQPAGSYERLDNPFLNWPGWGTQGWPIMLRKGETSEYFMLGDNSPGSKDSRLWWEIGPHLKHLGEHYQVGTVPEDQLIGQAFFVYWPSGYRRGWTADIGIIPNFGRMRWIR
jgi:signal peptidase I